MTPTMDIVLRLMAIAVPVLSLCVLGLVGWVWALWQGHNQLRLHVAENTLKPTSLQEVKTELHSIRDVVYRMALKMDVPVFTEPYKR